MTDDEDDPLDDLYEDKNKIDRERLAGALKGIIGVDRESGDPIFHDGYHELSSKEQFVAQVLYRRAAVAMGELDEEEQGLSAAGAAKNLDVGDSTVRDYISDSDLKFVESNQKRGGYVLPGYALESAISFISSEGEE